MGDIANDAQQGHGQSWVAAVQLRGHATCFNLRRMTCTDEVNNQMAQANLTYFETGICLLDNMFYPTGLSRTKIGYHCLFNGLLNVPISDLYFCKDAICKLSQYMYIYSLPVLT